MVVAAQLCQHETDGDRSVYITGIKLEKLEVTLEYSSAHKSRRPGQHEVFQLTAKVNTPG